MTPRLLRWGSCLGVAGAITAAALLPGSAEASPATASSAIVTSELLGVTAVSGRAWAVGYTATETTNGTTTLATIIDHWNGRKWTRQASPNPGYHVSQLSAVTATSASDAWAVGDRGIKPIGSDPLIEHWNGHRWSVQPSPSPKVGPAYFYGVAALSSRDAWSVGASSLGSQTLIEHWNGKAWRIQRSPSPDGFANVLYSVTALSPTNVWATGTKTADGGASSTLVEHWNGHRWSVQPSASDGTTWNYLNGVAAARGSAWAAGTTVSLLSGTATQVGMIERHVGKGWRLQAIPSLNATQYGFNAMTALSGSSAWAVGNAAMRTRNGTQSLVEHWNGKAWRVQPSPSPAYVRLGVPDVRLLGVAAVSGKNAWAVGFSENGSSGPGGGAAKTLIEHWNGKAWQVQRSPSA